MKEKVQEVGESSWPANFYLYFELINSSQPDIEYFRKVLESKDDTSKSLDANIPMTPMTAIPISPGLTKTLTTMNSTWYNYFYELWKEVKQQKDQTKKKFHGLDYFLVRYPLLFCILVYAMFQLFLYVCVRQLVVFQEFFLNKKAQLSQIHKLRKRLRQATSYEEWKMLGSKLDQSLGLDLWKKQPKLKTYDDELIYKLRRKAAYLRKSDQIEELVEVLSTGALKHNVGNIEDKSLYTFTHLGTKRVVEDFYNEMVLSLEVISNSSKVSDVVKHKFFNEVSQSYGKTALCLSGGAALGYMHLGVIQALLDSGTMPKIVTGTSAGSIVASMYGCRTDAEMREILNPEAHVLMKCFSEPMHVKAVRMIKTGSMFDAGNFGSVLNWVTFGNTTFLEAYRRTGKTLNITVVPLDSYLPPKLLNYVTAPNVVIWSAILASSAVPGIINPITLMQKNSSGSIEPYLSAGMKWRDGSLKMDIPIKALHTFFNVKYTIVSQVNPHIQLFFFQSCRVGFPSLVQAAQTASQNTSKVWRGGFIFSALEYYLKLDLKKWLHVIRDLELLPRYLRLDWSHMFLQKFDGNITVLPKLRYKDYLNILTDPDFDQITYCLEAGQQAIYSKLHSISNRTKIETKIAELSKLYDHLPSQTAPVNQTSESDLEPQPTKPLRKTKPNSLNLSHNNDTSNSSDESDHSKFKTTANKLTIKTNGSFKSNKVKIPKLQITQPDEDLHPVDLINGNPLLEFMVESFNEKDSEEEI